MDELSRANAFENFQHTGNKWTQRLDTIIDSHEDDDRDRESRRVC
jgi:hypothetical protein